MSTFKGLQVVDHVYLVPLSYCIPADYNPPARSDQEEEKIKSLAASMAKNGQKVPVHLMMNSDGITFTTIEGHGRIASALRNKSTHIKAIISAHMTEGERASTYQVINADQSPHKGADRIFCWLRNPNSVSKQQRGDFDRMQRIVGRPAVEKMVKLRKGWSFYYSRCYLIGKWVGLPTTQWTAFLNYFLDVEGAETFGRKMMERGNPADAVEIRAAFREGRCPCWNPSLAHRAA